MKSLKKKKDQNTDSVYTNGSLKSDLPNGPPQRQQPWSQKENGVTIIKNGGLVGGIDANKANGFANHQQPLLAWSNTLPTEKEGSYQPFKSLTGRSTPLEDPYQLEIAPQDPTRVYRPPSRAASMCSAYRKSEGSVVYQPLTPTTHASAWSNSFMFNKQPSEVYVDFLPQPPMPPANTMPHNPPINTIRITPDNLYAISSEEIYNKRSNLSLHNEPHRKSSLSFGKQPGGLAYTAINGYITTGAPPEAYQFQKPNMDKPNKVTVVPNGKVFGEPSLSGSHSDDYSDSEDRCLYFKKFLKVSALHIPLGLCLFALGISRLLLYSVWGLGLELVYGIYVVITGILGIYGSHRSNYCSLVASCLMSVLSCILCIPPFISGLLFTVPYSSTKFQKLSSDFFKSDSEPYGIDILLSVVCLLELIVSVIIAVLGCLVFGKSMSKVNDSNGKRDTGLGKITEIKAASKYNSKS